MFHALVFSAAVVFVLSPYGLFRSHTPEPQKAGTAKVLSEKEKKEKIDKIEATLDKVLMLSWQKRREVVMTAFKHEGIDRDKLNEHYYLSKAVMNNDVECVTLLLDHGSNVEHAWRSLNSVRMAQFLFDRDENEWSALRKAASLDSFESALVPINHSRDSEWRAPEPELIKWYVDHGVDPNHYYIHNDRNQASPLIKLILGLAMYREIYDSNFLSRVRFLMQMGGSLTPKHVCYWTYNQHNAPQLIKAMLQDKNLAKDQPSITYKLTEARKVMIEASNYRHDGLKDDLTSVLPVAELRTLVASYYIAPEPRYEELEAMPLP